MSNYLEIAAASRKSSVEEAFKTQLEGWDK